MVGAFARMVSQGIAFNAVGRRAILADPHFADGRYYDAEPIGALAERQGIVLAKEALLFACDGQRPRRLVDHPEATGLEREVEGTAAVGAHVGLAPARQHQRLDQGGARRDRGDLREGD